MKKDYKNLPEDILSNVEIEHEGTVVSKRRRRKKIKKEGNKVLFFMTVFIILIIGAGLVWIFFPSILSFINKEEVVQKQIDEKPIPSVPSTVIEDKEIDTDKDGLSDIQEQGLGLMIDNPDSDGDGLSDRDEVDIYFSDPRIIDTDGDGFSDGDEVKAGFDPNDEGRLDDITAVLNQE